MHKRQWLDRPSVVVLLDHEFHEVPIVTNCPLSVAHCVPWNYCLGHIKLQCLSFLVGLCALCTWANISHYLSLSCCARALSRCDLPPPYLLPCFEVSVLFGGVSCALGLTIEGITSCCVQF